MIYDGLRETIEPAAPHLGGNILEGDPHTYSPGVWDYVIARFAITSVLDLGCGIGYSADYFFRKGLRVIAVDGLDDNVTKAVYPATKIDLTKSSVHCRVDLVHCQEVVEHIEERFLPNLLASLATGKFVLMTHAVPGQPGHHHVNLQHDEYWISHMNRIGFSWLVEDTQRIREIAKREGSIYLANSGIVLANRERT